MTLNLLFRSPALSESEETLISVSSNPGVGTELQVGR